MNCNEYTLEVDGKEYKNEQCHISLLDSNDVWYFSLSLFHSYNSEPCYELYKSMNVRFMPSYSKGGCANAQSLHFGLTDGSYDLRFWGEHLDFG